MNHRKQDTSWKVIFQFSLDDFRNKYAGSFMGATWAFVQPVMTIVIYWFIFQVGFKSQPVEGCPFIIWLVSGLLPWFFVNEAIVVVTSTLAEYSYLVKKILFNISILPMTRIMSCFLVQVFLTIFTILFFAMFGYWPDVYYLQLPYYMLYMLVLLTGIGYCTAAFYPFFKDLIQIINIVMQIVFWLTPIVWDLSIMSELIRKVLSFNPVFYVVQGYRDIFVYERFFWENWKMGIYYWFFALLFLALGRKIFAKMKIHFADVL